MKCRYSTKDGIITIDVELRHFEATNVRKRNPSTVAILLTFKIKKERVSFGLIKLVLVKRTKELAPINIFYKIIH